MPVAMRGASSIHVWIGMDGEISVQRVELDKVTFKKLKPGAASAMLRDIYIYMMS